MEIKKPIYIQLEDGDEAWVKEYSLKKFKKDFIEIIYYPETIKTDPLNHKMVAVEEEGEVWYELVWEERMIENEEL